jgi:uncharacterized protein YbjQ (UPF0145 family)
VGKCKKCGADAGMMMSICFDCASAEERLAKEENSRINSFTDEQIQKVIITTSQNLEGHRVEKTIDIISAECAIGMNIFADLFAKLTDVVGGRNAVTEEALRAARRNCLYELKREALKVGANAVIAVSLDYNQFSGQGKSMLFLVASGTAVTVAE